MCRTHITHGRNPPLKCRLRVLQSIEHNKLRSVIKAVRLRIIIPQMGMHIAKSRQYRSIAIVLNFLSRKLADKLLLAGNFLNPAIRACQNRLVLKHRLSVSRHKIFCTDNHLSVPSLR